MKTLTADLRMYRHSGIGRYLRNLFPLLLPLLPVDRVCVLCRRDLVGDADWLRDPRVEFIEAPSKVYSPAEQLMGLRGAFRGSDLLWVPHWNGPLFYRGRMVVTIHDLAPLALPQILDSTAKRVYARLLIERSVRQADAILSVSEFTSQELQSRLHVPAAKITVTHPGIEAEWPQFGAPTLPTHREADGRPYFLYVGNVKPNKNLGVLLRAFARVAHALPQRLVVVGRMRGFGTGDEAVLRQAEAMGDEVRFAGEVSDTELMSLYAGATALVMPSLYEGFGLPLLEAMRLGCPVVSSNAGSLPEVGGEAALYFDPYSDAELAAQLRAIAQESTRQRLRLAGAERAGQFRFERCAEKTAQVFSTLLER